ncbi:MAG: pyridoxamine 5'-phosphate oxidase family protein, partial [Nitrosopumilus sp.]|nr:pyridoxamine 5'-phosphate oxidase family protein [Nitrosopumilus sp.]
MTLITSEIKNFLDLQKLGYVATVSSDGKPNISPKGTVIAWSSTVIAFADIRSPDTMTNLQNNPFV